MVESVTTDHIPGIRDRAYDRTVKVVSNGIKWLEANHGPNWRDGIDPDSLSMTDAYGCIIGQLHPEGYWDFIDRNGFDSAWSTERGFYAPFYTTTSATPTYDDLQAAWEYELRNH